MPKLKWISDKDLYNNVSQLIEKAKESKIQASNKFGKNVIDPFSALFEITGFELSYQRWHESETARQAQKTLQNHIGDFHQKMLGCCTGWKNMGTGSVIDLVNTERKIIAEIKNKYNTLSGGKLSDLYYSLESLVMPKSSVYKDYTAFYVAIIPKNSERINSQFTPSDKSKGSKCQVNKLIREIDGASFYAMASGQQTALKDLFHVLPSVISEVTGKPPVDLKQLTAFFSSAYID